MHSYDRVRAVVLTPCECTSPGSCCSFDSSLQTCCWPGCADEADLHRNRASRTRSCSTQNLTRLLAFLPLGGLKSALRGNLRFAGFARSHCELLQIARVQQSDQQTPRSQHICGKTGHMPMLKSLLTVPTGT